ncbi:hypothetical protein F2Q68_00024682 [Brassica cretica]|uniref:Uncharacterized protein n=1 Tax=Brassica cretica TaxID=69181 RepID=A0A8S9IC80_BRACR|nr:hypothetical protein F2Q68_00024682 [Brassica cretica]
MALTVQICGHREVPSAFAEAGAARRMKVCEISHDWDLVWSFVVVEWCCRILPLCFGVLAKANPLTTLK